jgi:hypothetical protein
VCLAQRAAHLRRRATGLRLDVVEQFDARERLGAAGVAWS